MAPTARGNVQPGNVHTDRMLTNRSIEFKYPGLIGELLSPLTPVDKMSDKYAVYFVDDENRLVADSVGPGGEYNKVEWGLSDDTFYCNKHGLQHNIPWETYANADDAYRKFISREEVARRLKHMVMLNHESKVATAFGTTGNYASGFYELLATNQFDDSGVNGLTRLQQEVRRIRLSTGGGGIKMVVTGDAWIAMQADPNFIPSLTPDLTANEARIRLTLGVEEIIVVDSQYNSADKGQTPVISQMWTANSVWLITVGPAGSGIPSALRTFQWQSPEIGTGAGEVVRVIPDEEHQVDKIQYAKYYDVKPTGVNPAGALTSAVWLRAVYQSLV